MHNMDSFLLRLLFFNVFFCLLALIGNFKQENVRGRCSEVFYDKHEMKSRQQHTSRKLCFENIKKLYTIKNRYSKLYGLKSAFNWYRMSSVKLLHLKIYLKEEETLYIPLTNIFYKNLEKLPRDVLYRWYTRKKTIYSKRLIIIMLELRVRGFYVILCFIFTVNSNST